MNLFKIHLFILCLNFFTSCGDKNEGVDSGGENGGGTETTIALPTVSKPDFSDITTTGAVIKSKVINRGGALVTNRGVTWSTSPNPTTAQNSLEAASVNGAGEFTVHLNGLIQGTTYYVRSWAKNAGGVAYSEETTFESLGVQSITFSDAPMFIIGSTLASYDAEIINNGGGQITERGICWSTSANPTIQDNKVKHGDVGERKYRSNLTGLNPRTDYNLRAYAINEKGISYSNNIQFRTINRGNVTYTFNKSVSPTVEESSAYVRLQIAIDSAVWYVNNYTSVHKHVYLNYVPGVATADANNEGWMRFGTGVGFQNLRTMLHEMNHTFGTGTTSWWWNQAISGGKYQLSNVNNVLRLISKDPTAVLSGDSQHWWPYGLNQNNEVTSSWDYVYNCLLIEAMRKDGMTSHSGGTYVH